MSLTDALLLEPSPFQVWIALRSDGQKGSGRIDDPWDGSTVHDTPVSITSIVRSGDNKDASVTTSSAHGYQNGQYIRISGATGGDAGYYNGAFLIFGKTDTTFKYRMKGKPAANASGTLSSAKIVGYRFDDVMRNLPANAIVRIGPGVFETRGFMPANPSWQPKTGQKIIGSGMGATTIKLVEATSDIFHTSAIGGNYDNYLVSFEASDFTVDCNLPNQPIPEGKHLAPVSCGAFLVTGRHTRIRRIRAINFGSQSRGVECFVIFASSAHPDVAEPVDGAIEDCIIEQPSENNVEVTTCLTFGGGERPTDGVHAYHRASAIRNCYVNCEHRNGVSSHYRGIESLTELVDPADPNNHRKWRLRTIEPHDRTADHIITIQGVRKQNTIIPSAVFNGTFPIDAFGPDADYEIDFTLLADPDATPATGVATIGALFQALGGDNGTAVVVEGNRIFGPRNAGPYHDTFSSKDLIIRHNYFYDVYRGVAQVIGGQSSPRTGSVLVYDAANSRAIFTSHEDHGLNTNDTVAISDAAVAPVSPNTDWLNNPFNRSNVAITKIDDKRFSYPLLSAPTTNAMSAFLYKKTSDSTWKTGNKLIRDPANSSHAIFTALEAHGLQAGQSVDISGAFAWDSTLFAYRATVFNGTFTVQSVDGLTFTYGSISSTLPLAPDPVPSPAFKKGADPKKCGSVILRDGNTATFSTVLAHGFSKRQAVLVRNARVNDDVDNTYNGNFEVAAIPTVTSFTYEITNPPVSVTAGGLPDFRALWQVRQFTVEDNVMRLAKLTSPSYPGTLGVQVSDFSEIPNHTFPYIYRQAVVRGNVIRQPESDLNSRAMALVNIEAGVVENNIVSMKHENPIYHQNCGSMKYFNNLLLAGDSLEGFDITTQQRAPGVAAAIEEVQLMALLNI